MQILRFPSGYDGPPAPPTPERWIPKWVWGLAGLALMMGVLSALARVGLQEARPWPIAACKEYYSRQRSMPVIPSITPYGEANLKDLRWRIESACKKEHLSTEEAKREVLDPMWDIDFYFGVGEHHKRVMQAWQADIEAGVVR